MMLTNTYTLTNDNRGDVAISMTVSGQAGLDEMLDAVRGFLVACGYHPDTVKRLDMIEQDEGNKP